MKKLMVMTMMLVMMVGVSGCKRKQHVEDQEQAQPTQTAAAVGPDATLHPNNPEPDDWNLPAGETFIGMQHVLIGTSWAKYLSTRSGNTIKVYSMEDTGKLELTYVIHER